MTKTKNVKSFDAVKMMREIRERISAETKNMTVDEIRTYIKNRLVESKMKPIGQ